MVPAFVLYFYSIISRPWLFAWEPWRRRWSERLDAEHQQNVESVVAAHSGVSREIFEYKIVNKTICVQIVVGGRK